MKILKTLGVTWLGFSLVAGLFVYNALALEPVVAVDQPYAYQILGQSGDLALAPGAPGWLKVTVRNLGTESWPTAELYLTAVYPDGTFGRISEFATSGWQENTRVKLVSEKSEIASLDKATFNVPVQAGQEPATFKEGFRVQVGKNVIEGEPISWLVRVGDGLTIQDETGGKRIRISLDRQKLWAIEDHVVVMSMPISSGKPGYDTPKGTFTIANHAQKAYSSEYQLYMDNWMGLAGPDDGNQRGYGIHKLPSWKVATGGKYWRSEPQYIGSRYYENGWLYEDAAHLGKKMSHGCIRVGIKEAPLLYNWAENGTVVQVG